MSRAEASGEGLVWRVARRIQVGTRQRGNWAQLCKFALVGGSGYLVNLAVFWLLSHPASMHHIAAAIGAFTVAVTNNWVWNRHWTFRATEDHPAHQGARFLCVSLVGLAVNLAILELLINLAEFEELPAQALAVATVMPLNFIGNKLWTFRRAPSSPSS